MNLWPFPCAFLPYYMFGVAPRGWTSCTSTGLETRLTVPSSPPQRQAQHWPSPQGLLSHCGYSQLNLSITVSSSGWIPSSCMDLYIQPPWAVRDAGCPPPSQAVGAHSELWGREEYTPGFPHLSCHLVFFPHFQTHSAHYGLPHLETPHMMLPHEPDGSPGLRGKPRDMRLLAWEKGRAWEQSSSHSSLDSWLQIWNRQVANLQSSGQLRDIDVGELGLIWLYKQRAEDQAELNLIHYCNPTGFLNSFLCCWWTEPARHAKSSTVTKLLVPLVISEAITFRRHT